MDLLLKVLGALGIAFGYYAGMWWFAQHMPWWAFSAVAICGLVVYSMLKALYQLATENRR